MERNSNNHGIRGIFKRRKKAFFLSFLLIFLLSAGFAFFLPPIYKSEAKILIENQEIPEDYVSSTITTFVNERIEMITQQIMRRDRLTEIINEYDLYPEIDTMSEKLGRLRKNVTLETIQTTIINERTARAVQATIAFKVSFEGKDPKKVYQIARVLSNLYIEEDVRSRDRQTGATAGFFEAELENLRADLNRHEERISQFKKTHIERLPGSANISLQRIARLDDKLEGIRSQLRTLREKKIYLQGQIATVDPLLPVMTDEGKTASNPYERLKELRLQLIRKQSILSEKHPDIKTLKSEIEELEAQVGDADTSTAKIKQLNYLNDELAEKRATLGASHPDVVRLQKEIDSLSREIDRGGGVRNASLQYSEQTPDNPAYMSLQAQIFAIETDIEALLEEKNRVESEIEKERKKIEMAPLIEKEYNELTLDYESAKQKYQDLLNKFLNAKIARQMDMGEQGEQFLITDAPVLPEKPYKPNRLAILLLGLVFGLGAGMGLSIVQENVDHSVRSVEQVESIVGAPVIGTVDFFESAKQKRIRWQKRLLLASSLVLIILAGSLLVGRYYIPLDTMWAKFENHLIEIGLSQQK